jgi:hypothetical protein
MLARFDRLYTRHYRARRLIEADKEVNAADLATRKVILFGDPRSNRWIARIRRKLPIRSTRQAVMVGATTFSAGGVFPNHGLSESVQFAPLYSSEYWPD